MADKLEIQNQQDIELKKELEKIEWHKYLEYGSVRIQVRAGKLSLTEIARTYPD